MNYKKLFKTSFSRIIPPTDIDSFERSVLERTEKMEKRKVNRFKKPLVAVVSAAAALALGVTGAAAAGLIDFGEIFGGHIKTDEGYSANELLTCGQDISWRVSDEDYAIEVKGIAGSERDVMVSFEIVRKDGKPVSDFMQKLPEDGILESMDCCGNLYDGKERTYSIKDVKSYTWSPEIRLTDEGNISVYDHITAEEPISGYLVQHSGTDFYPKKDMDEFRRMEVEADIDRFEERVADDGTTYLVSDAPPSKSVSLDYDSILSLRLDWSIEFVYNPSEASLASKSISDEVKTVSIGLVSIDKETEDKEYFTQDCTVTESHFSCTGGNIMLAFDCSDEAYVHLNTQSGANPTALITADGREIPAYIQPIYGEHDGTTVYQMNEIRYSESIIEDLTVVDIREVTGIKINDIVYPLE